MATKLIYSGKKLIDSGELKECLDRSGLKTQVTSEGALFLQTKANLIEVKTVRGTKVMIGTVELSAYLKKNKWLDKFLEANKEIFTDDTVDSFEKVVNYVDELKERVLVVGESIYVYNGRYYQLMDFTSLENECYKLIREVKVPEEREVEKAVYFAYKEFVIHGRTYDMRTDYSYRDCVKLAFLDGTLYINKEGYEFKKDVWVEEDNLFFSFELNYMELEDSNGIVNEWFEKRFYSVEEKNVAIAGIADLFVTSSFSQAMIYLYGAGGTGKSLLQESFSKILCKGATSAVNINDIGNQFKTAPLFKSIVNFSSEISRKAVSADGFKSIIARDEKTLSIKFKNDVKGRPIAKWFSVANSLPTIDVDSGVKRRLLAIEVTNTLVTHYEEKPISKVEFEQLFFADKKGMINIIIEGISHLMNFNFDLKGFYDEFVDSKYMNEVVNLNDSIAFFMSKSVEKANYENPEMKGILKDDLFLAFEEFRKLPEGTAISNMKSQTFYARIKELGFYDKRAKYKVVGGEDKYINSKRYYPNYRFTDEFITKIHESRGFVAYNIDDLKNPSMIAKEENVSTQGKSVLSGK